VIIVKDEPRERNGRKNRKKNKN
jgi:hypothetical protein